MLCSICKKNLAVIFINKQSQNENSLEVYCYNCAKEKGINPLEVLAKQSEILEGDQINMEDMNEQLKDIFADISRKFKYKSRKLIK